MKKFSKSGYLELLRTTKLPQARLFLREGTKFCALGLLCEQYRKATGNGEWVGPFYENKVAKPGFCFKLDNSYGIELPNKEVLDWAGLSEDTAMRIVDMNDTEKLSFRQIADRLA